MTKAGKISCKVDKEKERQIAREFKKIIPNPKRKQMEMIHKLHLFPVHALKTYQSKNRKKVLLDKRGHHSISF